jgi:hypothetical protein
MRAKRGTTSPVVALLPMTPSLTLRDMPATRISELTQPPAALSP